jgi:hypothetical protein
VLTGTRGIEAKVDRIIGALGALKVRLAALEGEVRPSAWLL